MNVTTMDASTVNLIDTAQSDAAEASDQSPTSPLTLDLVVQLICQDANFDSLKFVLRSDTGHDGE